MSIVTKGARKGLSIATVIGLAAGLLTGVVAPANAVTGASDKITATPSVGLRAETPEEVDGIVKYILGRQIGAR